MAVLSALVKALADVEGLEENQVAWVGRYLRETGFIAQGGRGRGGAQMSVADAANLLIGVNAASSAKHAVAALTAVCKLKNVDVCCPIVDLLSNDDDELVHALYQPNDALTCIRALLSCFIGSKSQPAAYNELNSPNIYISFFRPNIRITIEVREGHMETEIPQMLSLIEFDDADQAHLTHDKSDRTTITQNTLIAVGQALSI